MNVSNPAFIDPTLDGPARSRSRTRLVRQRRGRHGARRTQGRAEHAHPRGRAVVLADLEGPGTIRHFWMTIPPAPPERMRALWIEVFYDGADEPSVSVPCRRLLRSAPRPSRSDYHSALMAVHEGRGFNSYVPMPFREHVRVEVTNGGRSASTILYYQVDYTVETELPEDIGYLHVGFRRQNPTTMSEDFVIADGLEGPGRFLGMQRRRAGHRRG